MVRIAYLVSIESSVLCMMYGSEQVRCIAAVLIGLAALPILWLMQNTNREALVTERVTALRRALRLLEAVESGQSPNADALLTEMLTEPLEPAPRRQ